MLTTIYSLQEEILKMSDTGVDINSSYYNLVQSLHTMLIELGGHKQQKIKLSNTEDPSTEDTYMLLDYALYKVLDFKREGKYIYSFSLIITVKDDNQEILSFCYDRIENIKDNLINPTTLKYWITVRNRMFDSFHFKNFERLSNDEKEMLMEYKEVTYRLFLYD